MTQNMVVKAIGPLTPNSECELSIEAPGNPTFLWKGPSRIESPTSAKTIVILPATAGPHDYTVTAIPGGDVGLRLEVSAAFESPIEFDPRFALLGLLVCAIGGVVAVMPIWQAIYILGGEDGTFPNSDVGALVAFGLLLIGILIVMGGLFLAALEARGRMRRTAEPNRGAAPPTTGDWAGIVDAIGKLRGSALVLVIGCIPLLAAAWIGKTAIEQPQAPEVAPQEAVVPMRVK
jgi:hypothetical protein